MVVSMVTTETSGLKRSFFLFFISQCCFYSVKSVSFFHSYVNCTVQESSEEKNDGWETVHKKPPRRQHKVT